ncbi:MAG: TlpA family protein disulfide reductase, partial [Nitrospinae bacterium]|nr:TlpA family protein disulfide reductase [Nitrospinota bacterium]
GWTLVHFWATWCGPCVAELPMLQRMAQEMAGNLTVTTVNVDELAPGAVARWMGREGITLATLLDPEGAAQRAWGIVSLPTSYLVDPSGMVVGRADGARDWQDESVKAFLGEKMGG